MNRTRVLIVDDEIIMRESLAGWLERDGHEVATAASGEAALSMCAEKRFDIMLLDIKMEGISGLEVLRRVKESDPDVAVVMITAYGSISSAIDAMKNGAFDYLLKPFDPNELGVLIGKIIRHQQQSRENLFLREQHKERTRFENMIGQSEAMQKVFDLICDVAPTDSTVLITGETGTGKGLAARAIHSQGRRAQGPFVVVNCGAIPEHLMESELFGHVKGAFTDAKETRKGRLELAHDGTLFLDEIGEIGMRMQIDLLRVLEDRVFYRVGGTQPLEADFRVIAATNRSLAQAIREGRFREDPVDRITREAMDEMMLYDWPGNVRELQNAIERAVVVAKSRQVTPRDLPIFRGDGAPAGPRSLAAAEKAHLRQVLEEHQWNIARSARMLEIDRSTLYSKIRRYALKKPA